MIQSFYDAIENVLDCKGSIEILEELLYRAETKEKRQIGLNRDFAGKYPLTFTYLRLHNAERGEWHDRVEQDRWVTLPEVYALTKDDVVLLNFQLSGRLFIPTRTYTRAFAYGFSSGRDSDGPIFGLGYTLEEIKKPEGEVEPVIELTAEIRHGSNFFHRKEQQNEMPHTFLGIVGLKISEELYRRRNPSELFYQTLKEEYKIHLTSLLEREIKRKNDLERKLEQIEN